MKLGIVEDNYEDEQKRKRRKGKTEDEVDVDVPRIEDLFGDDAAEFMQVPNYASV